MYRVEIRFCCLIVARVDWKRVLNYGWWWCGKGRGGGCWPRIERRLRDYF